jgi:GNAT superfamily N-acetyltransferase
MSCAGDVADLFQDHRDELGFVNRAQVRDGDLATISRDGEVVGALLGNHCVRKEQSTVYELAVRPEWRREGIASELVQQFARESPHEKLIAKCPEELPANEFYRATGWQRVRTETGKSRKLNVWRYRTESVMCATTGRPDLVSIAERYGWLRGSRLDYLDQHESRGFSPDFLDLHWEDPNHEKLLTAAKRHRPRIVVAGDYDGDNYEYINGWADELREYADSVVIVPHNSGEVKRVPGWATVGYSTPSEYAGTDAWIWEYRGRDVHILGGTIDKIQEVYKYLGDSVVSIDCNSFHRSATQFGKWWGRSSPSWVRLADIAHPDNAQKAYENAMLNLTYAFRESGITST